MKNDKPYDKSVFQALTLILQFGINMIVPISMMCILGIFLDQKFHTGWITIACFLVGALAGGQNVYRMAKRLYDTPSEKEKQAQQKQGQLYENHKISEGKK